MKKFDPATATDSQLLVRFEQGRDQSAFTELVRRHGPMVMQVALRNLDKPEDAEDAFQATFFALAKAAGRIREKDFLAAWLHATVRKTASSIRRGIARHNRKMEQLRELEADVTNTNALQDAANDESVKILDEAIAKLPKKFQVVVVLCHLEGLSHKRAAERLSIPTSTVRDRLAKGNSLLKGQLIRRGVTMTLAGLTAYIATSSSKASAASQSLIADTTTKALLYAAGKSATEIGANSIVVNSANKVITSMMTAKMTTIGLATIAVLLITSLLPQISGIGSSTAVAGTLFEDDFNDGSYDDGSPVTWEISPFSTGLIDASSGDLIISPSAETIRERGVGLGTPAIRSGDTSIRTQARITETGGAAFVNARIQSQDTLGGIRLPLPMHLE